ELGSSSKVEGADTEGQDASADRQRGGDGAKEKDAGQPAPKPAERDEDIVLRELAVLPGSNIVGRSARGMHLRTRYGLNLLAVSRAGTPPRERLGSLPLASGDLLLMQGPA